MSLISFLNRIHFADGIAQEALAAEFGHADARRPLLITDAHAGEFSPEDICRAALRRRGDLVVFDETPAEPDEAAARVAAATYTMCDCDCIVAFGSSTCIDLAKAAALLVSHGGSLATYAAVEGGVPRIRNVLPPIIAVPTVAGSGSEVGRGALIVVDDGRKLGLVSPHLAPAVTICDPTLTLGVPARMSAAGGMDAIAHCIEAYVATGYNPPADGLALDGLRRAAGHIRRVVGNGRDLEARREMMAAALNGALALQKGLGGVHAISHALSGVAGCALDHGTLNAVMLPHVLEFNAPAAGERYAALRQAMDLSRAAELSRALQDLAGAIGLPVHLRRMGVDGGAVERAAPVAECDYTSGTNPRRTSASDYRDMMYAAL